MDFALSFSLAHKSECYHAAPRGREKRGRAVWTLATLFSLLFILTVSGTAKGGFHGVTKTLRTIYVLFEDSFAY